MLQVIGILACALSLLATTAWAQAQTGELSGTVKHVDAAARTIEFTDGRIVHVDPRAVITTDGRVVTLETVRPGTAVIVRGPAAAPGAQAVTPGARVVPAPPAGQVTAAHPPIDATGIVLSVDPTSRTVTLQDGRVLRLTSQSQIWQPSTIAGLQPGARVLVSGAQPVAFGMGGTPTALDPHTRMATVVGVDQGNQTIYLSDGTMVRVSPGTRLQMGQSSVTIADLRPGDEVIVRLRDGGSTTAVTTGPRAEASPSALPRQGFFGTSIDAEGVTVIRRPQSP
jgi:Cu/Ag efflux protein CusF